MSEPSLKSVLILDDDEDFRKLLLTVLGKRLEGVTLVEYDPVKQGVPGDDFDWSKYDVLLLDYYLCIHGVTGLDILQTHRKNKMFPATIMLTGAGNEEVAVRAIKAGVYDYLRKETLDKAALAEAIIEAFEKHQVVRAKQSELTSQSRAFNKALFYQELEDERAGNRVLVLIELDNHEFIQEKLGVIFRDNLIRHIAKQSFVVFKLGDCNPSITRFGENTVALLVDDPGSQKTLEYNLKGLGDHLAKHPYLYGDKKVKSTVSIGAVALTDRRQDAEEYITEARRACDVAAQTSGNSVHLFSESDWTHEPAQPGQATDRPAPQPVTPAKTTVQPSAKEGIEAPPPVKPATTAAKPAQVQQPEPGTVQKPGSTKAETTAEPPIPQPVTVTPLPANETDPAIPPVTDKKPTANPAITPAAPKPAAAVKPQGEGADLDSLKLTAKAAEIKKAFDEKRAVQTFQPVIPLYSDETDDDPYIVGVQVINKDGTIIGHDEMMAETNQPAFRQFIDRWMLREIIGRLVGSSSENYVFFLRISHDSLADASFFNWIRKMFTGIDKNNPGKQIVLEISATDLHNIQKQASALMSYMKKSHGFRFMLADTSGIDDLRKISNSLNFDLIRTSYDVISELNNTFPETSSGDDGQKLSILQHLKNNEIDFMADDVNDATRLTETISVNADFAAGPFIGEPMNQLDDVTNVESFEII